MYIINGNMLSRYLLWTNRITCYGQYGRESNGGCLAVGVVLHSTTLSFVRDGDPKELSFTP